MSAEKKIDRTVKQHKSKQIFGKHLQKRVPYDMLLRERTVKRMRITDKALEIKAILGVTKGASPPSHSVCRGRRSDALVYILSGTAKYTFQNGETATPQTGDILFLAKDSVYTIDIAAGDYTYLFVDFLFDTTEPLQNEVFQSRLFEKTANLFYRAGRIFPVATVENMLYCKSLVYNIYADVVKSDRQRYLAGHLRHALEAAVAAIAERYADPTLTVASLAQEAGMSEVYFRRLFKAQYGSAPAAFITAYRLSVARQLLLATTLPIHEIAAICGFDTPYYFARVFKASTSTTPLAFRRAYGE